jgi:ComEC/Rec2-related protein
MVYAQISDEMGDIQYEVQYGDKVRLIANLAPPPPATNPGMFSYRDFLHHQNYFAMANLKKKYQLKREGIGNVNPLVKFALDLKNRFLVIIKKTMPFPESAFLGGVQLGCRGGVSQQVQDDFRKSGVSHVLAVSGLHVTIIATMFYIIFSALKMPKKMFVPIIIGFLLVFTIITGARPSSTRAALMNSLVLIIMTYFNHTLKSSLLFGLSVAAVFVLWSSPLILFEPGFTLSFAAILSLAFITEPVERFCTKWVKGMKLICLLLEFVIGIAVLSVFRDFFKYNTFLIFYLLLNAAFFMYAHYLDKKGHTISVGFEDLPSIVQSFIGAQGAILLGMMWPLSAYYFNQISMSAPIANFIAIPLIGVIVQVGLIAGILGMIPGPGIYLALLLNAGNWLCVKFFLWMAKYFADIFPCPKIPSPGPGQLFLYFFIIGIFCFWPQISYRLKLLLKTVKTYANNPQKRPAAYMITTSFTALFFLPVAWYLGTQNRELEITLLDVRFGEALVISAPDGTNTLVDGGGTVTRTDDDGNNIEYSQGERTVDPFLLKSRILTLHNLFITSLNLERMGGLEYIFSAYGPSSIKKVYSAFELTGYGPTLELDEFGLLIESKGVQDNLMSTKYFQIYKSFARIYSLIQKYSIEVILIKAGDTVSLGSDVTVQILSPYEDKFTKSFDDISNNSVAMRLVYGRCSFVFLSDLRAQGLKWLDSTYQDTLKSDIVILPFYNSDKSFDVAALDNINPSLAIASFGFAGMAAQKGFDINAGKIIKKKIPFWSTSEQGAIIMKSDKIKWSIKSVADERKKVISASGSPVIDIEDLVILAPESKIQEQTDKAPEIIQ